jgi:LPS-assembly protein
MAPSADQRLLFDQGGRHLPGGPGYFANKFGVGSPGDRDFRGSIDTTGQFSLNNNWVWGWDGTLLTDKMVIQDYGLRTYFAVMDPFKSGGLETVTQLYLTGRGERSYFDARAMYFYGLAFNDVQSSFRSFIPSSTTATGSRSRCFGGELTYRANIISLTRDEADFDPITQTAFNTGQCDRLTADPALKTPTNCILRGFPGTTREARLRRHGGAL